ncbi:MAG: DUF4838 domain-containing protein [Lentisphaeria bacterium]|nr:DUF4838 domain-containing protein [Lentisphaeria bacterium]
MKKRLAAVLAALLAGTLGAETVKISPAERGMVILLPEHPGPGLRLAAEELVAHIGKASGYQPRVIRGGDAPEGKFFIALGDTAAARKHGVDARDLKHNQARVLGTENFLIINGREEPARNRQDLLIRTSGTLFTIYDILEKSNGVRWLYPHESGTVVPKSETFNFESGAYTAGTKLKFFFWRPVWHAEAWPSREMYVDHLESEILWLLRHRSNRDLAEQHYPHGFEKWPDKYLKTHPEFFNLLPDGTRRSFGGAAKYISMCLMSPAFQRQVVADWLANYNPDIPRINLKGNDSNLCCVCDACMAADHSPVPTEERRRKAKARFDKGDIWWFEELGPMTERSIAFYKSIEKLADEMAPEKRAKFSGLIYANNAVPPRDAELGPRFQFSFCPTMYFPWTRAKVDKYKQTWDGWYRTGADLVLRPNFTLDGHCYPINYARYFAECFNFAETRSLTGSDFDSLTGMFGAQGLTLYTIARLQNSRPGLTYGEIEAEYCAAFGAAAPLVREYFHAAEAISNSAKEPPRGTLVEGGDWTNYYLGGHRLFTRERLAGLKTILDRAADAVRSDPEAAARVHALQIGLEHARLTAEAALAYEQFRRDSDYFALAAAINALDDFRSANAKYHLYNIAFCNVRESNTWPRTMVRQLTANAKALPTQWKFSTDPGKVGEAQGWQRPDFDDSRWRNMPTDCNWEQVIGPYDGYGWYRIRIELPAEMPGEPVLLVGSADEACDVWINGRHLLRRPYPYKGNINSWNESFEVPFGKVAVPGGRNTIVIRVEDNDGNGGLTKKCILKYETRVDVSQNVVRNPEFKEKGRNWTFREFKGRSRAEYGKYFDRDAVRFSIVRPGVISAASKYAANAQITQNCGKLTVGQTYQLHVMFRTSENYLGSVGVFLHADTQTSRLSDANVQIGHDGPMHKWSVLTKNFVARRDFAALYLNPYTVRGEVYFAEAYIIPIPDPDADSAVKNPEFKDKGRKWTFREFKGKSKVDYGKFFGRDAVRFSVVKPGEITPRSRFAANAQITQTCGPLEAGRKYRLNVTYRTSGDFSGSIGVFLHADTQTSRLSDANIQIGHDGPETEWSVLTKDFTARRDNAALYLNPYTVSGEVYFAEARITPVE